ncbi:MAG: response regulator [Syntrophaceae bacterium]|nr:response regulator [Syntrophaceae bacterium]
MPKWLLSDLHIHTTFSDGDVPIDELIKTYGEVRFDVIAITDHLFDTQSARSLEIHEEGKSVKNIETYFKKIDEISRWAREAYDLLVIPGLEVCNLLEDYHILGIDLKEAINPNQDAERVIQEIHRQGGLAIASHPPLKLSYFINGDRESIHRHPLHLWKHRDRYANKIDAWEIANREDLFGNVGLERFPYIANSDFHKSHHIYSWKSMIYAEKEKEAIKKAIIEKKVALFFYGKVKETEKLFQLIPLNDITLIQEDDMKVMAGAKILIVDDEKDLVDMLAYHLERKGYKTIKAYDGYEAWEKIESELPDLLILDLMMPNLDGWELCRLIRRSQNKSVKEMGILILSARAMQEDRVYGLEIGADDYLIKPFSLNELILRIEKLAEKKGAITQLKEEVESLQSSIETKESNLRRIAHDLKSPLISIGFSAKRILRKAQNEETSGALKTIFESSLHLTQWIDETLFFRDLSKPKWQEQIKEVDVKSLVQQTIDLLKESASEKSIEIEFKASLSTLKIPCHELLMVRALVNLLSNALKYTPRGGKVEVALITYLNKRGNGVMEISFKDNGIGIYEEDLEKVFEPYYRGKNISTEEGKGLGLSFVKEVIELHGGKILVQSELKKGSTFSILLPIKNVPQEEIERIYQEAPPHSNH